MAKRLRPLYDQLIDATLDWLILSAGPNYRVQKNEFDDELVRLLAPYYLSVAKRLPPGKKRSSPLDNAFQMYALFDDEEGAAKLKELLCEDWIRNEEPDFISKGATMLYWMWPPHRLWCIKHVLGDAFTEKRLDAGFTFILERAIAQSEGIAFPSKAEYDEMMRFLASPEIAPRIARNGHIQHALKYARKHGLWKG